MFALPHKHVRTLFALMAVQGAALSLRAEQIIAELDPEVSAHDLTVGTGLALNKSIAGRDIFLFDVPPNGDVSAIITALRANPNVVWAEINRSAVAPGGETQSFFVSASASAQQDQYAISLLGLEAAHTHATGAGVTVAVLDTGVWSQHELFGGNVLAGYNFVDDSTLTDDAANGLDDDGDGIVDELSGHGTFVAGIIATSAPDAAILPVTVLNSDGVGSTFLIAQGVYYALESGADVINLSVATLIDAEVVRKAVGDAAAAGVVIIASVSNTDRQNPVSYPAAYPAVLAVAATDSADAKAVFSDYGQYVDLAAPGDDIVGPLPGNLYGRANGASAAAAFVSGGAALLLQSAAGESSFTSVADALRRTSANVDSLNPAYAGLLGSGRVQIDQATSSLASQRCADLNGDSVVDVFDLLDFLGWWFAGDAQAEWTGDWPVYVDVVDLLQFLADWFEAGGSGC